MKRQTRRKLNLMRHDPHCHWCGCEVVTFVPKPHQTLPDNFATLDHLNDKILGPRPEVRGQETTVLACKKCNEARAIEKIKSLPKEFLWAKSGRYPRIILNQNE